MGGMTRKKRFAIAAIAIAVIGSVLTLLERDNTTAAETPSFCGITAEYRGTEYCEVIVDFGYVQPSATVQESIRLTNRSDSPIVLLDYSTQCRCMWLDFERKPIVPNESCDITLTFDSRGEWGSVGNYMEITTSHDSAPIVLWIGAEIE